jgi:deazaflavin-dependent oxidoreductase (nitroreductase family)
MRKWIFRLLKLPPRLVYSLGLGTVYGRFVLLLTTRGRRSGKARVTPLQYERVDGALVVASARGTVSDWYRNLVADPGRSSERSRTWAVPGRCFGLR